MLPSSPKLWKCFTIKKNDLEIFIASFIVDEGGAQVNRHATSRGLFISKCVPRCFKGCE